MLVYPSLINAYDFEVDGIYYTVTSFDELTVAVDGFSDSLSGNIEIPSSITYSNRIFSVKTIRSGKSKNVKSLLIPSSITEIEGYAFTKSNIQKIDISDSVTELGNFAFQDCTNLYSVKISKNVFTLKEGLFWGCTKLTDIVWHPETNKGSIKGRVFWGCTSLKTIRIPAGVYLTGGAASSRNCTIFKNCTSLDSLIIEDGVGKIEVNYDGVGEFSGSKINYVYLGRPFECNYKYTYQDPILRYVEHLEIGDMVTLLPTWLPNGYTWSDSKRLKTLIIGKSLTQVPNLSYYEHPLKYIKIKRSIPPEALGFSNYNYLNTILYVPKGSKTAYESADIWKYFWNIEEYSIDGSTNDLPSIRDNSVKIQNTGGQITINGVDDGSLISVYNSNGIKVGSTISFNGSAVINTILSVGSIAIIKIGEESIKIIMK